MGVASRDDIGPMEEFIARHDFDHIEHIADVDGTVWQRNGIGGQPAWVFIDGETGETTTEFGALDEDALNARIDTLTG